MNDKEINKFNGEKHFFGLYFPSILFGRILYEQIYANINFFLLYSSIRKVSIQYSRKMCMKFPKYHKSKNIFYVKSFSMILMLRSVVYKFFKSLTWLKYQIQMKDIYCTKINECRTERLAVDVQC